MTRRDWWLEIAVVTLAVLLHAAVPRYTVTNIGTTVLMRVDRWTGGVAFASPRDFYKTGWLHLSHRPSWRLWLDGVWNAWVRREPLQRVPDGI